MTTLFSESFETDGNGTRYTTGVPEFSDGSGDFFTRTDGSNIGAFYQVSGGDGGFYFGAMDLDGEGATLPLTLELGGIDISGATDLGLSVLLAEDDDGTNQDWDDSDFVRFEYRIDGGTWQSLFQVVPIDDGDAFNQEPGLDLDNDGVVDGPAITSTFQEVTAAISGTGGLLDLRVTYQLDSGDEDLALDFLRVTGTMTEATPILINEVLGSTTGADSEYIELIGEAGASLAGLSLVVVESDDQADNGTIDFRFDFADDAMLGDNGFYLLANTRAEATYGVVADAVIEDNTIENSSYTLALVETASIAGFAVSGSEVVLDAVGVTNGESESFFAFGAPVVGPDGAFLPAGLGRVTDGVDTDTAADWEILDFNNASPPNDPTSGGTRDVGPGDITLISAIQGSGSATPLAGQTVTVEAVVTLVSPQLNGFFMQEEDADADADAATSEGIFVFTGSDPTLSVGDRVQVTGTASEFFDATQIGGLSDITVLDSGVDLPSITEVALPLPGGTDPATFFETLEGMRVEITAGEGNLVVTDTFTRFGEVGVTSDEILLQSTQVFATGTPEQQALAEANARDILLFENAIDDSLSSAPRAGDGIVGDAIEGVMHFTFGDYKVETDGAVEFDPSVNPIPRPTEAPDVGGTLKVASFNVLNYFTTLSSEDSNARGAATAQELADQTAKIVAALAELDADVVGLIEIENDLDPTASADEATVALVDALNALVGAGTYDYIATGTIGGDAIKQAFIYKTETVTPQGDFAVLETPEFLDPLGSGRDLNRPALAQTFEEIANGESFTAAVNHLKSKGSPSGVAGDDDPVEGSAALTRVAAAQELAAWLATDPTGQGDPDQLILGDLNAYAQERAIQALVAEGYTDLAALFEGDPISYAFDGEFGTLDYAMANEPLLAQVTGTSAWNINSLESYSIQYDGTDFATLGDLSQFASSDHDPIVVGLALESPVNVIQGTAGNDNLIGTDGDDLILSGGGRQDKATGGEGEDTFAYEDGPGRDRFVIEDFTPGEDVLDLGGASVRFAVDGGRDVRLLLDGGDRVILRDVGDIEDLTVVNARNFAVGTDDPDTFVFENAEGRERALFYGFDTETDVLDLGGAEVSFVLDWGRDVRILTTDRDWLTLFDVADFDDITIVNEGGVGLT